MIAVLTLQSVIAGVCRVLKSPDVPEHVLIDTDSKCAFRGRIKVDLHACS